MRLLEVRGGFLYEHRPDLIPHGYITDEELSLWAAFYERRGADGG